MMKGTALSRWCVMACWLSACSPTVVEEGKREMGSNQFFDNSVRRETTESEAAKVGFLETSRCAAFFVENTAGKVYVVTARHCVDFALDTWCSEDGVVIDNFGAQGTCVRVVVADDSRDIALFEADIAHASSGEETLRLAAYVPEVRTKLVMVGYPTDEDPKSGRFGMLTTTTNCWVLSEPVESPYARVNPNVLDRAVRHNCSTYRGNSGGPMYVEGTRDAIGLPFSFMENDYERRKAEDLKTSAHLALVSDFVSAHREVLVNEGIVLAETQPFETTLSGGGGAPVNDVLDIGDPEAPVIRPPPPLTATDNDGTSDEKGTSSQSKTSSSGMPTIRSENKGCAAGGATPAASAAAHVVGFGVAFMVARARRRRPQAADQRTMSADERG